MKSDKKNIKKGITLKTRITISVISLIFLFGILATVAVFFYTKNTITETEKENFEIVTVELSDEIGQIFNFAEAIVEELSSQEAIIEYLDNDEMELQDEYILEHLEHYSIDEIYSAIYIMDSKGLTVASTVESFVGNNYGYRDYFVQAMEGDAGSDVVLGATSKKLGYYFSYPIVNDSDEIIGVAVMKMNPEYVNQFVVSKLDKIGSRLMLVDKEGIIIYSDDPSIIYKSLGIISDQDMADIISSKRFDGINIAPLKYQTMQDSFNSIVEAQVYELYDELDDENEIVSIARINNSSYFIVFEQDADNITASALNISYVISIMVLFAALATGLLVYIIVNRSLKALSKIEEAAISVGEGDFDISIDLKEGSSDLLKLSKSFNDMIMKVKNSRQEIETKVKEQTKELVTKNEFANQQQKAVLNILEDVEEEKTKSEELADDLKKFQLAVDYASDHIVITDVDGIILYANKAVEKITGFTRAEVVGKKAGAKDLWGGLMSKDFYEKFWKTIKIEKKTFSGLVNNIRKNGEKYIAYGSISPVLDDLRNVQFFVGIERDVTKEQQIDKAKTEFVSLASHQLRTPLSTINWYSEMLLDEDVGKLNKEQKEYMNEIYDGNKRMVDLVGALLNVSRIDLGTMAVELEDVKFTEICDSVIKEMIPQTKEKEIKINIDYAKNIPIISADRKLVRIIFQNFISNAVKYTPANGKVEVVIKKDKKYITVSVSDNGYGIPKNQQDKIFTKLFRADNIRKTDTEGTGLGLYIVKSIAEQSGGKVWFDSEENKGTTFYISLPLSGMKATEGTKGLESNTK
ncbi:MAG: ATP-binding protein [Candidatus Kerfeldbacteria bacterium]